MSYISDDPQQCRLLKHFVLIAIDNDPSDLIIPVRLWPDRGGKIGRTSLGKYG